MTEHTQDFYVLASTSAGLALLGMGRGEHAGDVYDEWIADHANEPSPDLVLRTDASLDALCDDETAR